MARQMISVRLENLTTKTVHLEDVQAIVLDHEFYFVMNNVKTQVLFKDGLQIFRMTDDYILEMPFILNEKTKGVCAIPALKKKFFIEIKTHQLEVSEKRIYVAYEKSITDEVENFIFELTVGDKNER